MSEDDYPPEMSVVSVILLSPFWIPFLLLGGFIGFLWSAFIDGMRLGRYYGSVEFYKGRQLQSDAKIECDHTQSR